MKSLLILALLITTAFFAQGQTKFESKSFQMDINGTSTMHNWASKATNVAMWGDFNIEANALKGINSATVEVQTKSIKSNKESSLMDNRTHSTLKADKNPLIKFVFSKLQSIKTNGNEATITLIGNLTIGGNTQATELAMKGKVLSNGELDFSGVKKLKMSTYSIKAPTFMLGALSVGDEVTVTYHIILKKTGQQ